MKIQLLFLVGVSLSWFSCQKQDLSTHVYNQGINLIPTPETIIEGRGSFELNKQTQLVISHDSLSPIAEFYAAKMRHSTGYPLEVSKDEGGNKVCLKIDPSLQGNEEGYELKVTTDSVIVIASTLKGLFYGMSSFVQLLPAEIESKQIVAGKWMVPAVEIKDKPRFEYRGLMLDVARHFISVEGLKKHIDMLATIKINYLHLHLTDYQGWRIEIKKYPKLTEIGSHRIDEYGKAYSGFYTQEEMKEIVRYAQERFITIIPEIDIPGHSLAAIAAYPELSCTGEQYPVMSRWGGFPVVFCPGKEVMFEMLDGIFAELSQLFPSKYFHIGGDECPKDVWKTCPNCQKRIQIEGLFKDSEHSAEEKLQSYAIIRCEQILHKYGKKMIGWDEILQGGLAPDATVMSWRGEKGGIAAALMKHPVIMTPTSGGMYLDYYQGDPQVEPFAWGAFVPIEKTYAYNPIPDTLVKMKQDHWVKGVQANTWSECMYSESQVEYQVYPRVLAVAEIGWSPLEKKDFKYFSRRLNNAAVRMDYHSINYHIPIPEQPIVSRNHIAFLDSVSVSFTTSRPMKMVYTLDGSDPTLHSSVYKEPLLFDQTTDIRIRSVLPSGKMSPVRSVQVERQTYVEAESITPRHAGLKLRFSPTRCLYACEIKDITLWKDSVISDIESLVKLRKNKYNNVEFYVAEANGFMYIAEDGIYEFTTNNTRLWINNKLVVDNDGKPQINSKYGRSLALRKGWHSIKVLEITNFIGGWSAQHRNNGSVSYRKSGEKDWIKISGKQGLLKY